jgi:hypothetical protein
MNDYLQIKELYHHGIKGQKWGIRRYQNEDGSLTDEGYTRYKEDIGKLSLREQKKAYKRDLLIAKETHPFIKKDRPKDLDERREKNDKKLSDIYYKYYKTSNRKRDKFSDEETANWIVNDDGHMLIVDEAKRSGKDTSELESELSKLEDEWGELHDARYADDIVKYHSWQSIISSEELVRQAYGKTVQEAIKKDDRIAKNVAGAFITIFGSAIIGSLGYILREK